MKFCFLAILFLSSLASAQEKVVAPPSEPPPAVGSPTPSVPAKPPPVPSELLGPESPASANGPPAAGSAINNVEKVPGTGEQNGLNPTTPNTPTAQPGGSVKEDYVYDPTGRRDPFMIHKSFQKRTVVSGGTKKVEQNLEGLDPLIKIDLDKLELVGIIWEVANPRALVLDQGDPEHKVHIVNRRTKIGRNNGYVAAIREGEIVIIETFEEAGIVNQQPKVIRLQVGK